ncbi:MAG: ribose 5-phosphate isomerase B [Acidobacteria bacterium]|nr:ribose 5-phosphate isomerase B [Acidobacteriota bacterium]MBI3471278.1 ribose 5-phosphate isomerase B [Candidatus Solibacter usitatus]
MKIALGADHAGFLLKERLKEKLRQSGHEVVDHGAHSEESVDYPDFAAAVARDVAGGASERGLLVCSSGVGMSIAANKVPGARAALGTSEEEVRLTRQHNDANVLTLGQKFTPPEVAERLVDIFLTTAFEGGRHSRRVAKIAELERND